MTDSCIRILCVDDHPIVREGIALILQLEQDMEVVGLAATADEAVAAFRTCNPDITLMDLNLAGSDGAAAIRAIRQLREDARVIVLTMHHGDEDIRGAFAAGATTYLLKEMLSRELVATVRAVYQGQRPISASVRTVLDATSSLPRLTHREIEVLNLVADGKRNKEVATSLGVSDDTVESHLKHVFAKLGVTERTTAVKVAVQRGIIRQ